MESALGKFHSLPQVGFTSDIYLENLVGFWN